MNSEKLKELAEQSGFHFYDLHDIDGQDLGETVEADSWSAVDKFAKLIVGECIYQIQRGIVLNGITPENKRSEKHISDIAHLFDMEFDDFGDVRKMAIDFARAIEDKIWEKNT